MFVQNIVQSPKYLRGNEKRENIHIYTYIYMHKRRK